MALLSRNVKIDGRRTSIRLEQQMWTGLHDIAQREKCSVHDICSLINVRKRKDISLTASIRIFIMLYYRTAQTEEGHRKAGHGDFRFMEGRAKLNKQTDEQYYEQTGLLKKDIYAESC